MTTVAQSYALLFAALLLGGCGPRIERRTLSISQISEFVSSEFGNRRQVAPGAAELHLKNRLRCPTATAEDGRCTVRLGDGSVIEMAILDKECRIGRGVKLVNRARIQDADGPNGMYHIRDGIICVPRNTVVPDGTVV